MIDYNSYRSKLNTSYLFRSYNNIITKIIENNQVTWDPRNFNNFPTHINKLEKFTSIYIIYRYYEIRFLNNNLFIFLHDLQKYVTYFLDDTFSPFKIINILNVINSIKWILKNFERISRYEFNKKCNEIIKFSILDYCSLDQYYERIETLEIKKYIRNRNIDIDELIYDYLREHFPIDDIESSNATNVNIFFNFSQLKKNYHINIIGLQIPINIQINNYKEWSYTIKFNVNNNTLIFPRLIHIAIIETSKNQTHQIWTYIKILIKLLEEKNDIIIASHDDVLQLNHWIYNDEMINHILGNIKRLISFSNTFTIDKGMYDEIIKANNYRNFYKYIIKSLKTINNCINHTQD